MAGGTRQKIKDRIRNKLDGVEEPKEETHEPTGFTLEKDQGPFEQATALYLHIRREIDARIDRCVAEVAPLYEKREQVEAILAGILQENGQESARTKSGTVSLGMRRTAKLEDAAAFMDWVIENKQFDLIERRAAAVPVDDWSKEHNGELPPGCVLNKVQTVSVRKS